MGDCSEELYHFIADTKYSMIESETCLEKYPDISKARRHEFTIRQGEMLYIPAGWFHWVFSDEVGEDGLNYAFNYWYETNWNYSKKTTELPFVKKHSIPYIQPVTLFKDGEKLRLYKTKLNGLFPSDRVFRHFPNAAEFDPMTFKEFLITKNPAYYLVQHEHDEIKKYTPISRDIWKASLWVNFGGARTLIHYDEKDNFLCQISGTKRVILFPPEDRHLLYMFNPVSLTVVDEIQYFIRREKSMVYIDTVTDITDVEGIYTKTIENYKIHLAGFDRAVPDVLDTTAEFNEIDLTGGKTYGNTICQHNKFWHFFIIKEGEGVLMFQNLKKEFYVRKNSVIIFPNTFVYPFVFSGDLKIIFLCK